MDKENKLTILSYFINYLSNLITTRNSVNRNYFIAISAVAGGVGYLWHIYYKNYIYYDKHDIGSLIPKYIIEIGAITAFILIVFICIMWLIDLIELENTCKDINQEIQDLINDIEENSNDIENNNIHKNNTHKISYKTPLYNSYEEIIGIMTVLFFFIIILGTLMITLDLFNLANSLKSLKLTTFFKDKKTEYINLAIFIIIPIAFFILLCIPKIQEMILPKLPKSKIKEKLEEMKSIKETKSKIFKCCKNVIIFLISEYHITWLFSVSLVAIVIFIMSRFKCLTAYFEFIILVGVVFLLIMINLIITIFTRYNLLISNKTRK